MSLQLPVREPSLLFHVAYARRRQGRPLESSGRRHPTRGSENLIAFMRDDAEEKYRPNFLVRIPARRREPSADSGASSPDPLTEETTDANPYVYIPNTIRLPTILAGPVESSPTYHRDSILSRESSGPGQVYYRVQSRVAGKVIHVKNVPPECILEHVSAAELERFENDFVKEERRKEDQAREDERVALELSHKVLATKLDSRRFGLRVGNDESSGRSTPSESTGLKRKARVNTPKALAVGRPRKRNRSVHVEAVEISETTELVETFAEGADEMQSSMTDSEEEEFELEGIVDDAIIDGIPMYLIKWVGYSDDQNTWQTEESLMEHASDLVRDYIDAKNKDKEIDTILEDKFEAGVRKFLVKWEDSSAMTTWEPEDSLPPDTVEEYLSARGLFLTRSKATSSMYMD